MGIPVFFKTCIEDYNDICRKVDNDKIIDHLFLDLNCLIHPCCQGETDETIMIGKIIKKMKYLFDLIQPKQTFLIAIDGPCPKPKMIQQRIRRFKSIHEHKIWDTNAITPGTKFMEKLEIEILNNLSLFSIIRGKTIFSSCLEPGEGEHKIFDYIKKNKIDNNVIYGLDADLIMLSLISTSDNIQLLRETTEYKIENIDSDYVYLDIKKLKRQIINKIKPSIYLLTDNNIIEDYIFICFLLGNDFVYNTPSINLRYGGLDCLLETYTMLCDKNNGTFFLVDKTSINNINIINFKQYIYELSLNEDKRLQDIMKIRNKQEHKFKKIYYGTKDKSEVDVHKPIVFRDKEKQIFSDLSSWRNKYYMKTIFNETYSKKHDALINMEKNKIACAYIKSLLWTLQYYVKGCRIWRYSYDYNIGPSLIDIYNVLKRDTDIILDKEDKPYTTLEQLINVLPLKSHHLIEGDYKIDRIMYPETPQSSYLLKRYLWEEYLILPKL